MQLQKYISETLSFFKSKYYLEQNTSLANEFEKIMGIWQEMQQLVNAPEPKKSLIKRDFSKVINALKEVKRLLKVSSDRRLLTSLNDLLINIRRETNKEANYNKAFNTDVNELVNICKLTEKNTRIFKESRIISVRYPKIKK